MKECAACPPTSFFLYGEVHGGISTFTFLLLLKPDEHVNTIHDLALLPDESQSVIHMCMFFPPIAGLNPQDAPDPVHTSNCVIMTSPDTSGWCRNFPRCPPGPVSWGSLLKATSCSVWQADHYETRKGELKHLK